jgi:hypothetical protein
MAFAKGISIWSLSRTSAASLPAPAPSSSSSPPLATRDGKGVMAVPYFATALRLARHGGRCPLECRV